MKSLKGAFSGCGIGLATLEGMNKMMDPRSLTLILGIVVAIIISIVLGPS
jgi:hypothetical protein